MKSIFIFLLNLYFDEALSNTVCIQYLMQNNNVTLSIVSHGHGGMVENLLGDIKDNSAICKIILTKNIIGENIEHPPEIAPNVVTIENTQPKGFSENHNLPLKSTATLISFAY